MMAMAATCIPIPGLERPKALRPAPRLARQLEALLHDAAAEYAVTPEDMRSRSRSRCVAQARMVFWWVAREAWGFSYPELGRMLGHDHTTVMYGVRRVADGIAKGERLGLTAERLRGGTEAPIPCQPMATGASSGPSASSTSNAERGQQ